MYLYGLELSLIPMKKGDLIWVLDKALKEENLIHVGNLWIIDDAKYGATLILAKSLATGVVYAWLSSEWKEHTDEG